jgi:hypothetical protein
MVLECTGWVSSSHYKCYACGGCRRRPTISISLSCSSFVAVVVSDPSLRWRLTGYPHDQVRDRAVARPVVSVFRGLSPRAARMARAAAVAAALTRAHLPPIALSIGRASRFASTLVHLTLSPHLWMRVMSSLSVYSSSASPSFTSVHRSSYVRDDGVLLHSRP